MPWLRASAVPSPLLSSPSAQREGGGGDAGLRGEYAPSIGLDSTEQAILRAVNDGAGQAVTSQAGLAGVENTEVGSTYPEHATYADGVRGSVAALASGGN